MNNLSTEEIYSAIQGEMTDEDMANWVLNAQDIEIIHEVRIKLQKYEFPTEFWDEAEDFATDDYRLSHTVQDMIEIAAETVFKETT